MIRDFFLVALGGAAGSVLRYGTALFTGTKNFPVATLMVNIIGSFLIGLVFALSLKSQSFNNNWKPLLAAGLCGGFTTFSAFSLENLQLLQQGKILLCIFYIALSVTSGLLAAWLGYQLGK